MTIFACGILGACGTQRTIVATPPTHSATSRTSTAPPPANLPTSPKPAESVPIQVAPPPPAQSPIAQLLANPPPIPALPTHTCPTLPKPEKNVPIPGKRSAVVVTVMDYLSLAPITDVQVNIFHGSRCYRERGCVPSHPHPENELKMTGKTDALGRIVFEVPDLDYAVVIPEDPVPGHLPFSPDYNLGKQKCHDLSHERRTVNGRALVFDGYIVPETMLRIRSQNDAIAMAMQLEELVSWLRAHQDVTITVRGGGHSWEVGFGYDNRFNRLMHVTGFDGGTAMLVKRD